MRKEFFEALYNEMRDNNKIFFVTGDLGYGLADKIKQDFPDRFINVGAAEQTMVGVGIGLALEGKIPVVYSITPFLLYRPFELIRNYINHEEIPVRLVGSGRDFDYSHDGFSHHSDDDKLIMSIFKNIETLHPKPNYQPHNMKDLVRHMINTKRPIYINLSR